MATSACGGQARPAPVGSPARQGTTQQHASSRPGSGILGYGHAASPAERSAVVRPLRGYLLAQAADNGARACAYLTAALRQDVAGTSGSCAASLRKTFGYQTRTTRSDDRTVDVTAVRIDGIRAFIVFHQPGVRQAFYPLSRERRRWRLGAIGLTALP